MYYVIELLARYTDGPTLGEKWGVDIHNAPGCKHIEPSTAKVRLHFAADSTTGCTAGCNV